MKKKITASILALALAVAMPVAAFAAEPSVEGDSAGQEKTFADNNAIDDVIVRGATADTTVTSMGKDFYESAADVVASVKADDPNNTEIEEAARDYIRQCNKIIDDGASVIGSFVINGEVKGETATVTVYLNDYYAGQVVTYVILHEDGSIQKKTVRVNADGSVKIIVSQFSAFTFLHTDGLEGYVPVPQDGAVSPKTGF